MTGVTIKSVRYWADGSFEVVADHERLWIPMSIAGMSDNTLAVAARLHYSIWSSEKHGDGSWIDDVEYINELILVALAEAMLTPQPVA